MDAQIAQMQKELAEAERTEVVEHADGSLSVELCVPIERSKSRVEAVTMRRPTAEEICKVDLAAVERGDLSTCVEFIHSISNLTAPEVRGMDGADFIFIATQAIRRFFRRRPRQLARTTR